MKLSILCTMCGLHFVSYHKAAKTCSPRCRKRRERVRKGIGGHNMKMGVPPNPNRSFFYR